MALFGGGSSKAAINNARRGAKQQKEQLKKGRKDINKAEDKAIHELTAAGDLGRSDILGAETKAQDYLAPIADAAKNAYGSYGNFYGQGGQEGFDQAQSDWQHSPLYQAMTDQNQLGIQGLDRQANARGNPYNFTDQSQYLQQNAGKYLGDYTGGLWNMAGQAMPLAQSQSQVATGTGGRLADLGQGIATTQATGVHMPSAYTRANLRGQSGQASADMFANITAAQNASASNNANMWGNILGLAGKVGTAAFA